VKQAIAAVEMIGDLANLAAHEAVCDRVAMVAVDLDDLAGVIDEDAEAAQIRAIEWARARSPLHRASIRQRV
jgi:hypothetical protein